MSGRPLRPPAGGGKPLTYVSHLSLPTAPLRQCVKGRPAQVRPLQNTLPTSRFPLRHCVTPRSSSNAVLFASHQASTEWGRVAARRASRSTSRHSDKALSRALRRSS